MQAETRAGSPKKGCSVGCVVADEPLARQRGLQLLRALAPHAISGQLEALWPPFAYLPAVPLLGSALAAVGRKDWMRAWFQEDLAVPEGVDWEVIDGVTLASRLLDELDRDAFESRALVQNMALWFQASPGYTTPPQQARPPCPPRPPGILQAVGYDPATGEVEYAADVSADARVTWWELGELAAQVRDKRLSDGREILGVRVVFSREDAALANSVPLIDCGVRVLGYDSDGDEVEISWD